MKRLPIIILLLSAVIFTVAPLQAEYVFKKDGAIIKGTIVRDEATSIEVKTAAGNAEKINRDDIIRIVYTDLYLGKVYARLTSGEVVEGYQVYENRDFFFFRKDLSSPDEITLPRSKVLFIVRTNPTDLAYTARPDSATMTWSPPFKPAKSYKVYIRDIKAKDGNFTLAGETKEQSLHIPDLKKSWSYEVYATAVNDAEEESLPSEKIEVRTIPESPLKLRIKETRSADGKTATLDFSWQTVQDAPSRVVSYNLYELEAKDRKKIGSSADGHYILENFPASGKHRFAVVAVNDDRTESDDLPGMWDAGLKPVFRATASYLIPMGKMKTLASAGYGMTLYAGIANRYFDAGLESGFIRFQGAQDVKSMYSIPLLAEINVPYTLWRSFGIRPVLKAGISFDFIDYVVHDEAAPLSTKIKKSWSADPVGTAGVYADWAPAEYLHLFAGAEYSVIFQSSLLSSMQYVFGAGVQF